MSQLASGRQSNRSEHDRRVATSAASTRFHLRHGVAGRGVRRITPPCAVLRDKPLRLGRADRPDPDLSVSRLRHRRPAGRPISARGGAVPDHCVGRFVDRHHPARELSDPAHLATGVQGSERWPCPGHAACGGAALRSAGDPARLCEPVRDPAAAARHRDWWQHRGSRLRPLDCGQHPWHVPPCLLVHPDVRHASDARGIRPCSGCGLRRGFVALAASSVIRGVRSRCHPRVDLSSLRHKAAAGRQATL